MHFTGTSLIRPRHFEGCVSALFRHNLRGDARRPRNLRASAGLHFYCVDYGTYGDIGKRERVARLNVCRGTRKHLVADRKSYGRENVSLFAVGVREERDVRRTVGVVLNALNRCGSSRPCCA